MKPHTAPARAPRPVRVGLLLGLCALGAGNLAVGQCFTGSALVLAGALGLTLERLLGDPHPGDPNG